LIGLFGNAFVRNDITATQTMATWQGLYNLTGNSEVVIVEFYNDHTDVDVWD